MIFRFSRNGKLCLPSLPVSEYAANRVKKSIVGVGHADKDQVAMMVQRLLSGCKVTSNGAGALAVAICHAHFRRIHALLDVPKKTSA